ncbi:sporulation peptidase YabG [Caminicella sporogenes]|uniref:sporulation peptidase YabG n=1 Tax=Caminicella sporogenes TaxID=166485 RepID=UPI002F3F42D0
MADLKIGDIVARKSYNYDVLFKVTDIVEGPNSKKTVVLKGLYLRLVADSPESDIKKIPYNEIDRFSKDFNKKVNRIIKNILKERKAQKISSYVRSAPNYSREDVHFGKPGKVLHIDGDGEYLDICLKIYKQLEVEAVGLIIPEKEQPKVITKLLREYNPDILVLTGHDSLLKNSKDFRNIKNYRNSCYFVESVKEARKYEPSMDELVIFAGACQSLFEAIIQAGANYASSPHRILIHCLDPVFISEKIAYTSVDRFVSIEEVLENTITGIKGIGGLQTRGKYRKGLPKSPYQ